MTGKTLYDKIWDAHLAHEADDGTCLLYIDRHLVHEVTSPQAFEGLRMTGRTVHAPDKTIAVPDHNVPTTPGRENPENMTEDSRVQVAALDTNAKEFGIHYYPVTDIRQGIVHIVGPEQGWTLPGMTVVCGDSHTATHGAFGALAHGIGTSEVEHVLATQTLIQKKSKNMKVEITGKLQPGVTAKDITLAVIGATGTAGGTGYVIEYCGEAIRDLSMEGRMTVCNMAIEGGARAGLIAPDEKTYEYVNGRPHAPKGAQWEAALNWWKTLYSDDDAHWDKVITLKGEDIAPVVTWGTSPEDVLPITATVPNPSDFKGGKVDAGGAVSGIHGPQGWHAAVRDRDRYRLYRILHQWPDRRSARCGCDPEGQEDQGRHPRDGCSGLWPCAGASRGRGAGGHLQRGRVRMASCGMFNVPCHEPRPTGPRRTLRRYLEPQLRRPSGPRWTHPSDESRNGRRSRHHRQADGCARFNVIPPLQK